MSKRIDINFYSVPDTNKVSGGSRTRIRSVIDVLKTNYSSHIICGNSFDKIKGILKAPKSKILYVESSTNRLKLIDVFCLIILFFQSGKRFIYIRDIYIELFPEDFNTFRKKITLILNRLTNMFYAYYASVLCFPTKEMADSFYSFHPSLPLKECFVFPPGIPKNYGIRVNTEKNKFNEKISFLYLGGTTYFNSGFNNYIKISEELKDYDFYVITNDNLVLDNHKNSNLILLHNLSHKEVLRFIDNKEITFAIHTRPRNEYDDLTFPIKILDFLAAKLPVITLKHKPLCLILPKNYPFFCEEISSKQIISITKKIIENPQLYNQTILDMEEMQDDLNYTNKFREVLQF